MLSPNFVGLFLGVGLIFGQRQSRGPNKCSCDHNHLHLFNLLSLQLFKPFLHLYLRSSLIYLVTFMPFMGLFLRFFLSFSLHLFLHHFCWVIFGGPFVIYLAIFLSVLKILLWLLLSLFWGNFGENFLEPSSLASFMPIWKIIILQLI